MVALSSTQIWAQEAQPTEEVLGQLFHKTLSQDGIHNGVLAIDAPQWNIQKTWSGGSFRDGTAVREETPFHTASIGKTITATVVGMLVEEGKLGLDDPMHLYLPDSLIRGLHVWRAHEFTDLITLRHLLSHRSGLADYFEDEPISGENMMSLAFAEPNRFWTPLKLLSFAKENFEAKFPPGTDYHYTDTEYILLGLIIEGVEQKPLHEVFQKRIFEPLGMTHTHMHLRSKPLDPNTLPMAELYFGTEEVSSLRSLSSDWAGGGLQSTAGDLMVFLKALFAERLVGYQTLQQMQAWSPAGQGVDYGLGLARWKLNELSPFLPELTLIGHSGFTASFLYYCPELEIYLSGSFNQAEFQRGMIEFLIQVLQQVEPTPY
jgi:D-alanyl-D-alanine carboxypeptidase